MRVGNNYQAKTKMYTLVVSILLFATTLVGAQNRDSILFADYFNKSIPLISNDRLDTLNLRSVIFNLIDKKLVAKKYEDIERIFGKPLHTYFAKDGTRILLYPLYYTEKGSIVSELRVLMVDKNLEIIYNSGYIYFMETDEEFDYWYNNPPPESEEGSKNCPPRFKN